jgi:hypothetical protein
MTLASGNRGAVSKVVGARVSVVQMRKDKEGAQAREERQCERSVETSWIAGPLRRSPIEGRNTRVSKRKREYELLVERGDDDALLDEPEGGLIYMRAAFRLCLGFVSLSSDDFGGVGDRNRIWRRCP